MPGLLLAAVQSGLIAVVAKRRNFPVEAPVPLRELPRITWEAMPALLMPVILLGCLYSGITTPTEAAAVAAAYALLVSALIYRSLRLKDVYESLVGSARVTVSIGMLIAGALVLQLRHHVGEHPEDAERGAEGLRALAAGVPAGRQRPAAGPGLLPRGIDDHPRDPAGAAAHRAGARHRHGALRRDVRRQHHARAGHAAVSDCCSS